MVNFQSLIIFVFFYIFDSLLSFCFVFIPFIFLIIMSYVIFFLSFIIKLRELRISILIQFHINMILLSIINILITMFLQFQVPMVVFVALSNLQYISPAMGDCKQLICYSSIFWLDSSFQPNTIGEPWYFLAYRRCFIQLASQQCGLLELHSR